MRAEMLFRSNPSLSVIDDSLGGIPLGLQFAGFGLDSEADELVRHSISSWKSWTN